MADSLVALELDQVRAAERLADLGAGGGFPGLPLAIAMPTTRVALVESAGRKCAFLVEAVRGLGGLAAIAISHPHYYSSMVEWSRAFGGVPIYLHAADRQWVMRPDPVIDFWKGGTKELFGGLTLVNTGGHFEGFQVLHWQGGAGGKGVLLSGDQPQVCRDRRWVSFMYSYPNLIPLPAKANRRIDKALKPLEYERLYGAFPGLTVAKDAKGAVGRSAARYLKAIGA